MGAVSTRGRSGIEDCCWLVARYLNRNFGVQMQDGDYLHRGGVVVCEEGGKMGVVVRVDEVWMWMTSGVEASLLSSWGFQHPAAIYLS